MKRELGLLFLALLCALPATAQQKTGIIKGAFACWVNFPAIPFIQMGADPMCSAMNAGKRPVQEVVAADIHGNLANVFVKLEGNFPRTPIPAKPAVIDQQGCIYSPRVIGMRVGQKLEVRNEDPLSHNVHIVSKNGNDFSITMSNKGTMSSFTPKAVEVMLRVACDFHRWMTAYIGVVANPYFAVSGDKGTFEITNVPPGTYTIEAWQELYGPVTKKVTVTAGGVTQVDFSYKANESQHHAGRL